MSIELDVDTGSVPKLEAKQFELFRSLIYQETGIHLKTIKQQMLAARLARRLRAVGLHSFQQYYSLVKTADPYGEELRELINAVTTNLTAFFREPAHFVHLKAWLGQAPSHHRRLRFWSAASSTGQEPYSLSIALHDALGDQLAAYDVRILATDIDTQVLSTASEGIYRSADLESLSPAQINRYFLCGKRAKAGLAKVKPAVRELICFRQLNLVAPSWPVNGPFDAIFCRNVLIYFDEPTQRKVIERLRALIRPGGLLFVGHAETLQWAPKSLTPVAHAIYEVRP